MSLVRQLPIKRKVSAIIFLAAAVSMLVSSLGLFAFQLVLSRQTFTRNLSALAEVMANSSTAALTFDDRGSAKEILSGLKATPHVKSAYLRLEDGTVFARFGESTGEVETTAEPVAPGHRFEGDFLINAEPIILEGQRIGTLVLCSDVKGVYVGLFRLYAGILLGVLTVASLLVILISNRLQGIISTPVLRLVKTAQEIAKRKDYNMRAEVLEHDEIGSFTEAFNQMLDEIQRRDVELQQARERLASQVEALQREVSERHRAEAELARAHRRLLEASRQAGMAEVATGVLHNVGNVLNSVNVSAGLIAEQVGRSRVPNVRRAARLLVEADDPAAFIAHDPRGRIIPGYLEALAEELSGDRDAILEELGQLSKNVHHIKEIVGAQQSYAMVSGILESLPAQQLVEDAIGINATELARSGVRVERDYRADPSVTVDKHKILQVLVNLLSNALHAVDEAAPMEKRIVVSVTEAGDGGVQITVGDNGVGIPEENLTRVFSHGFTTRERGHGFGLHSGALAAKEMGGALSAQSAGRGEGSSFLLTLPGKVARRGTHTPRGSPAAPTGRATGRVEGRTDPPDRPGPAARALEPTQAPQSP